MPMLVTRMGQGLMPAGRQTILVHHGGPMRRVAVQHKVSMPEMFHACVARGCCLQAQVLTTLDPLCGGWSAAHELQKHVTCSQERWLLVKACLAAQRPLHSERAALQPHAASGIYYGRMCQAGGIPSHNKSDPVVLPKMCSGQKNTLASMKPTMTRHIWVGRQKPPGALGTSALSSSDLPDHGHTCLTGSWASIKAG